MMCYAVVSRLVNGVQAVSELIDYLFLKDRQG